MACATLVESVAPIVGSHVDCDAFCLSSSLGWVSPRISFSKDFAQSEGGVDKGDSYDGKETTDKDSISEFEFSMSMPFDDTVSGGQMLAADELFFKGKLLPLYIPRYAPGSEKCASRGDRKEGELIHVAARRSADQKAAAPEPSTPVMPDIYPTSPKTPRCSTKLKDLLGLKKIRFQGVLERSCMPRPKQRVALQNKPPLANRAKRLFFRSDDGKGLDARFSTPESCSTAEPLLASVSDLHTSSPNSSIPLQPQPCKQHPPRAPHDPGTSIPLLSAPFSLGTLPPPTGSGLSRSNSCDNVQLSRLRVKVLHVDQTLRSTRSREESSTETGAKSERSEKGSALRNRRLSGSGRASGETSPARKSGVMSPAGQWSPSRSSGAVSPGRSSGTVSPGRPSLGEGYVDSAGINGIFVVRNLERSSSSPTSLRRRYDHLRAVRQREGWRGLERSTSYSSSVRVTPVLNVPVCMSPGLRGARGSKNGAIGANGANGAFGLGQLFTAKKEKPVKAKAKATQIKQV